MTALCVGHFSQMLRCSEQLGQLFYTGASKSLLPFTEMPV